jgi:hypothetical protein
MAYSSASAVLVAIVLCVIDHDLSNEVPQTNAPPEVDFILGRSPAQSESANPCNTELPDSNLNNWTILGLYLRYLAVFLIKSQSSTVGFAMPVLWHLLAYCKSARSTAK